MNRNSRHLLRPNRSKANRARPELARLDREIAAAKALGDAAAVAKLETEKAWLIANSIAS